MATDKLMQLLLKHEGMKLFPYMDTAGRLTIGVGRNLADCGISEQEAMFMLESDVKRCEAELDMLGLDVVGVRRDVVLNMLFNLGVPRFKTFKKMLAAIANQAWDVAAQEMLNSKWAQQVGKRADELAEMMKTGRYLC